MQNLIHGDCQEELLKLQPNSIDSCVTDPPYGIEFVGNKWDQKIPAKLVWQTIMGVLKPGAHLLAFSSPRTYHRCACEIEDAGFELIDQLQWLFGKGFPKGKKINQGVWEGFATRLKPAYEPIILAKKPMNQTVMKNLNQFGTGVLNIDACRIPPQKGEKHKNCKADKNWPVASKQL